MKIERVVVLLPGLSASAWQKGGALIARKLAHLLEEHVTAEVVTYVDREDGVAFLDDELAASDDSTLYLVTWGPHINDLVPRLGSRRYVYYAQSPGWGIELPPHVPILCLSRFLMAFWMEQAPSNPIFLLPPVLEPDCRNEGVTRDVDVLYLARKSTAYLADHLIPALEPRCRVHTLHDFVPRSELFALYNRSKVYVYSSAPWRSGWVEGFGLQPLEALACGCDVFSNLHGGLSDYLEPGLVGHKLETVSLEYDVERILLAVEQPMVTADAALIETYSTARFHQRIPRILGEIQRLAEVEHHTLIHDLAATDDVPEWRYRLHRLRKKWMGGSK